MVGRDRISERPLERDQIGPANRWLTGDAPPAHPAYHVHGFRAADEHLFRIATPQGTGAAERQMVDDGDRPARRSNLRASDLCSRAGPDYHQIVFVPLGHLPSRCFALAAQVSAT